jgi:hypothetical protein
MTYQCGYTLSLNLISASVVIGKVVPVPKLHTIKLYIWNCKLYPFQTSELGVRAWLASRAWHIYRSANWTRS